MIYTPANTIEVGKPVEVFVNGCKQESVVYADTTNGIVRKYRQPLCVKDDEVVVDEVCGVVRVAGIRR